MVQKLLEVECSERPPANHLQEVFNRYSGHPPDLSTLGTQTYFKSVLISFYVVHDMTLSNSNIEGIDAIPSADKRIESEILRLDCRKTVKQLFPHSGKSSANDVIRLTAIYLRDRFCLQDRGSRLSATTKAKALDKLLIGAPFYAYDSSMALIDLLRYMRILAEAFRSFKEEETAIEHDVRNKWHSGLIRLEDLFERASRRSLPAQIERCDLMFFLKHCQYLLIAIDIGEVKDAFVNGVLQGFGNQYIETKVILNAITRRKRKSRPTWHDEYLIIEEKCFDTIASPFHSEVGQQCSCGICWRSN